MDKRRRQLLALPPATLLLSKKPAAQTVGEHAAPTPETPTVPATGSELEYPPVTPGLALEFPRDHGAHPDFRTEWWYLTGWLETPVGPLGVQLTFFRSRTPHARTNPSRFAARQLYFAHAAIADPSVGKLMHAEQAWRADDAIARAAGHTTDVVLGRADTRWTLRLEAPTDTLPERYVASVPTAGFAAELEIRTHGKPALQGEAGFSRKGPQPAQASYYYSRPQLSISGTVTRNDQRMAVTGTGWLDHEWSSELLDPLAEGWDWTGINLHDGSALMAFRMRSKDGGILWTTAKRLYPPASADGDWRGVDVSVRFEVLRRWRSPRTDADYPVVLRVVTDDLDMVLEPLFDDQELDSRASTGIIYWEGAVRAQAYDAEAQQQKAAPEIGRGYLELTGYATPVLL